MSAEKERTMAKPKRKAKGKKGGPNPPRGGVDKALQRRATASLEATSDLIRLSAGVFLAFQDVNAASAADIEEAMERTPEERAKRIAQLEKELRKAEKRLAELNEDLPENEFTAKAVERVIAEIERELFALKTAQAVAEQYPEGRNADEWRKLLRDAIRAGQEDAFNLVLNILLLPNLAGGLIRGASAIRSVRGFFAWLLRSKPAKGPKRIPWNQYAEGYARRFDELKRVIQKERRELDDYERAVGRLQEWVDGYEPIMPGPP